MMVKCGICGFVGEVYEYTEWFGHGRLRQAPGLWLCDDHRSEIRYQVDSKADSFKTTDEAESKKGHEDVKSHE